MLNVVQQSIDADGFERVVTLSDVINTYTYLSNFDPEKDLRIVEVEGVVVGYVRVNWNETIEGYLVYRHIANLLPEWRQKGIGTAMIRWAFARANDALLRVPENARVSINAYTIGSHKPSKRLLEDNGMKLFRHSWMMIINLEDEIPEPQWPDGIILRPYDHEKHAEEVYSADYEAFQDHFGFVEEPFEEGYPKWLHHMVQDEHYDPTLWYLAFDGDQIAGGAICRPVSWEDPNAGWVRSIFVRRAWRRRGLALALLRHAFLEFRKRGKQRAGLEVDAENLTDATQLYKKKPACM
jgi:GNAT superfamily N-acetyltransferase